MKIIKLLLALLLLFVLEALFYSFLILFFPGFLDFNSIQYLLVNTISNIVVIILLYLLSKLFYKEFISTVISRINTKIFTIWIFIGLLIFGLIFCIKIFFISDLSLTTFKGVFDNKYLRLSLIIVYSFIVSLKEELIFRGYIINSLIDIKLKKYLVIILSSSIFTIYHLTGSSFIELVFVFIWGVLLAYIIVKYHRIEITIGLHFSSNLFSDLTGNLISYNITNSTMIMYEIALIIPLIIICFQPNKKLLGTDNNLKL